MELANIIATNIQNLLDEHNVSVSEISTILGISRQTMTNYLKAASIIDSVQLAKIADHFNVSILELYTDNTQKQKPNMIFRTALNYSNTLDQIETQINDYLKKYISLAQSCNKSLRYFPEQYNLILNAQTRPLDINYECQNYFDSRLKIDNALDSEILKIANDQRVVLGMGDKGAISLIAALSRRGINVIFTDLGNTDIFGLSICDDTIGCFIFVNANNKISIERQLFTLAHEYGHILMHRPIYKRVLNCNSNITTTTNLLDKMADCFAGYLLAPDNMLSIYSSVLSPIRNDLNSIYRFLIPLKFKFQISLQSLLIAFRKFGYISPSVVNDYFRIINMNNSYKEEPNPISEQTELANSFYRECNAAIIDMIHTLYTSKKISITHAKEYLITLTTQSKEDIDNLFNNWDKVNSFDFDSNLKPF